MFKACWYLGQIFYRKGCIAVYEIMNGVCMMAITIKKGGCLDLMLVTHVQLVQASLGYLWQFGLPVHVFIFSNFGL